MGVLVVIIPKRNGISDRTLDTLNGHGLIVGKGTAIEAQRVAKNMKVMSQRAAMRLCFSRPPHARRTKGRSGTHHLVWYTIKYLYCVIVRDLTWGLFIVKTSDGEEVKDNHHSAFRKDLELVMIHIGKQSRQVTWCHIPPSPTSIIHNP